ncbi:MAG TPA: tripartite tricarboxylate transporter substrate binding protein [Burkholderiales bacterium]|jgi:tripartite-type tricarboxylate transporter receptor subunit TctC|nr:tripartite tricarboxylate transporter substrate binding protein [Burkholderiales bacterium]
MKAQVLAATFALISIGAAQAQTDYPNRPLRQIVPFPPGGGVDIVTRIVGAKWSEILGQPIMVENRAGAGGTMGAEAAAKAPPDGYTLLTCQVASHGVSPAVYAKLPYDAIRDFAPVSLIGKTPNVLVVHPSVPAQTLAEFVAYVKASPGKYPYASPGYGTSPQMTMELFKLTAGLDMLHVPYKGGAPALQDVMGGQVIGMFGNLPEQLAAIKGGKTRALAVSTLKRSPQLPGVPTVAESGFPGFEVTVWYGVCTQSAVPKPILDKLHATLVRTLNLPEIKARLAEASIEVSPTTPEEFAAFIRGEIERWSGVVLEANIARQ